METVFGIDGKRFVSGRLEGLELTELIRHLGQHRKTGILGVRRSLIYKQLYFQDGRVVFAASNDPNDRLGETLLRRGAVGVRQLELALRNLGSGKRIGTLMVDAGVLTPQELHAAVLDQIKAIFLDLLTWAQGEYNFTEGPLPSDESITLQFSSDELLFQGIRSIRSGRRISHGAGSPRSIYALSSGWKDRVDGLNLTLGEKLVLERLSQGEQRVEELCREISVSSFEVQRTLWAFKLLGLVETSECDPVQGREGRLSLTPFSDLVIRFCRSNETGVLYLHHGDRARSFHFSGGRCVFATSNDPDDGLVTLLYRRGVISLSDRVETSRRLLSNKRVGTILREMGVIDDQDLQEAVRHQTTEIVYGTFAWEDGEFTFVPGPLPSVEETPLDLTVGKIISEGVRRIGSWTRVLQGCGGLDNPLCLTPDYLDVLDSMGAGVTEWEVVGAIKQPQTPRRVCSQSDFSDFHICQILWILRLLGGIEDSPVEVDEALAIDGAEMGQFASVAEETGRLDDEELEEPVIVAGNDATTPPAEGDPEPDMDSLPMEAAETGSETVDAGSETVEAGAELVTRDTEPDSPANDMESESVAVSEPRVEEQPAAQVDSEIELELEGPTDGWSDDRSSDQVAGFSDAGGDVEADDFEEDMPDGVDEVIYRFNAMHRIVYRAVRSEIGAGAANFVRSCCVRLNEESSDPVEGVVLHSDGSWDEAGLKKVISQKKLADPWEFYQRVLDTEFSSLEPHLGSTRSDELKQKIWEIEQT